MMETITPTNSNFHCLNIRIHINPMTNTESQAPLDKVPNIRKIKITLRTTKEMRYFADLISQRFNNAGNKKTIESEMLRCL